MAEIKITELNEIVRADLNDTDVLPIVDVSDDETKKVKLENIRSIAKNEYSDSTLDPYSANYTNVNFQTREAVLYNNETGDNGNITLSDSAENYSKIKIYFRDNDNNRNSVEIFQPNGKSVSLLTCAAGGTNAYIKMKNVTISGTSITRKTNDSVSQFRTNTPNTSADNYIYILRVEGIN